MRIITSTHPEARLTRKALVAAAIIVAAAAATLPPVHATTTRLPQCLPAGSFVCRDAYPLINYCTNSTHPHYWPRMNTGTTNGGNNPGGSVGIRMRLGR